jgi:hypothetical protein
VALSAPWDVWTADDRGRCHVKAADTAKEMPGAFFANPANLVDL